MNCCANLKKDARGPSFGLSFSRHVFRRDGCKHPIIWIDSRSLFKNLLLATSRFLCKWEIDLEVYVGTGDPADLAV